MSYPTFPLLPRGAIKEKVEIQTCPQASAPCCKAHTLEWIMRLEYIRDLCLSRNSKYKHLNFCLLLDTFYDSSTKKLAIQLAFEHFWRGRLVFSHHPPYLLCDYCVLVFVLKLSAVHYIKLKLTFTEIWKESPFTFLLLPVFIYVFLPILYIILTEAWRGCLVSSEVSAKPVL